MLRRQVCPVEAYYLTNLEMCQLAMKVADPKLVPKLVKRVCHAASGFHLRLNGSVLEWHNTPYEIAKIPNEIQTAQAAADYMDVHHWPDFRNHLAVVGHSDNMVVLSANHICTDGGFLLHLYNTILSDDFDRIPVATGVPLQQTEIFKEEIAKAGTPSTYVSAQEGNSAVWRHGLNDVSRGDGRSQFLHWTIPATKMQCWDNKLGRTVGLTEHYMTLIYLATSAFNGKFTSTCCVPSCVDMRQFMRKGYGFDVGNNFVIMSMIARNIKKNTKIGEVIQTLRANRDVQFITSGAYPYTRFESFAKDGMSAAVLSNIGKIEVKHPFEDVWIQQTGYERLNDLSLVFLTWSKVQNGRNDVWGRMRYSRNVITVPEAKAIAKSMEFGLANLALDTPIEVALKRLRQVQDSAIQ